MEQLNFRVRRALHRPQQRAEADRADVDDGMIHSWVLHAENHLQNQTAFRGHFNKAFHSGMVQIEWLITGIDSKARHFVNLVTAANVLLPIRPGQVNAAKRNQEAGSVLPAFDASRALTPFMSFESSASKLQPKPRRSDAS
jgi:hypothetical protein